MKGSYSFDSATIENTVDKGKVGNYALGYTEGDTFYPKYVGRSDNDLQGELKAKLPTRSPTRQRFKFSYAGSSREAFEKECIPHLLYSGLTLKACSQLRARRR